MDLATLDLNARGNEGAWIKILGPAGQDTKLEVLVAGARSDRLIHATEEAEKRFRAAVEAKKVASNDDFDRLNKLRDEEVSVAAVLSWRTTFPAQDGEGVVTRDVLVFGGEELPPTPANVLRIMRHKGLDWLAAQVFVASRDAGLFTQP